LQAFLFLLALIVRAANRPADYDSDEEFINPRQQVRQPLLNRQAPSPAIGVPASGTIDQRSSRNDAWSARMREKVQSLFFLLILLCILLSLCFKWYSYTLECSWSVLDSNILEICLVQTGIFTVMVTKHFLIQSRIFGSCSRSSFEILTKPIDMIFAQDVFTYIYGHTRANTVPYIKKLFRLEYLIIRSN